MTLRRIVLEFKPDGIQLRTLYRSQGGPNPGTVRRRREVEQLARDGLTAALKALEEGPVVSVGEAGYEVREDTLSAGPSKGEGSLFLSDKSSNCLEKGA